MAVTTAVQVYENLSETERAEFRANVGVRLPPPTGGGLNVVWIMVIAILGLVAIGGGLLVYLLIRDDKDAEAIVAFASAALGALVGLIAPSPASPAAT